MDIKNETIYTMYTTNNHYQQSEQWALARHGSVWRDETLVWQDQPLRTLVRSSPLGKIVFIPGFYPDSNNIPALTNFLRSEYQTAFICKLETLVPKDERLIKSLQKSGWESGRTTQYSHTVQFDLTTSPEILLRNMKKRARNELNRAVKNNVKVVEMPAHDNQLDVMYELLANTAARKKFSVHDKHFLFTYWRAMRDAGMLRLFQAQQSSETNVTEKKILAAAIIIVSQDGKRAWYKEGASTLLESQLNAPRLLLWEVAKKLQKDGVQVFDLGGIPEPITYEHSHMKGIYIFKTAYSPNITTMMPVYELPLKPLRYKLWPKTEIALRKLSHKQGSNWY